MGPNSSWLNQCNGCKSDYGFPMDDLNKIGMEYGAELKIHINIFTILIGSNGSSYSSCMRRVPTYPTNRANAQQVLGYFSFLYRFKMAP